MSPTRGSLASLGRHCRQAASKLTFQVFVNSLSVSRGRGIREIGIHDRMELAFRLGEETQVLACEAWETTVWSLVHERGLEDRSEASH